MNRLSLLPKAHTAVPQHAL